MQGFKSDGLLLLLLNTAQLEYLLKNLFQALLNSKDVKWNDCKKEGSERMTELGTLWQQTTVLVSAKNIFR